MPWPKGGGRDARPHPNPLPRGEGEKFAALLVSGGYTLVGGRSANRQADGSGVESIPIFPAPRRGSPSPRGRGSG